MTNTQDSEKPGAIQPGSVGETLVASTERSELAARAAAEAFRTRCPLVSQDVTVSLTPSGWVAFDWVSRTRLYPPRLAVSL